MRKPIALLAGLALAASVSATALAYPSPDTALAAGYDDDELALVYGVSTLLTADDLSDDPTATSLDCTFEGPYVYVVDETADPGTSNVSDLYENTGDDDNPVQGDEVEFGFEEDETGTNDAETVLYSSDDASECHLTSVDVTGPQGQVNHGTIVSAFVRSLRESGWVGGMGCVVRHIAQTDWGKDDQQLQVGDEAPEPTDPKSVTLETILTACQPGPSVDGDDDGPGASTQGKGNGKAKVRGDWQPGSGPPPWAQKGNRDD